MWDTKCDICASTKNADRQMHAQGHNTNAQWTNAEQESCRSKCLQTSSTPLQVNFDSPPTLFTQPKPSSKQVMPCHYLDTQHDKITRLCSVSQTQHSTEYEPCTSMSELSAGAALPLPFPLAASCSWNFKSSTCCLSDLFSLITFCSASSVRMCFVRNASAVGLSPLILWWSKVKCNGL